MIGSKTFWIRLLLGFAGLMLRDALKRLVSKNKNEDFDAVLRITKNHVEAMAVETLPPEVKHDMVFTNVKGVTDQWKEPVKDALINMAIEMAVNALKAQQRK